MSDVVGGMTRSFRWRLFRTDHSFFEFPALEVIFLFQKLSSFRSSRFRFPSISRIHAMQSISERVRLYRLSHIMTLRFAVLQSLWYHGVSGRSLTEMFSTERCSSTIRSKVPSYKSKTGQPATWSRVHRRRHTAESSAEIA